MADLERRETPSSRDGAVPSLPFDSRSQRLTAEAVRVIVRAESEQDLLQEFCRVIVDEAGYPGVWVAHARRHGHEALRPHVRGGCSLLCQGGWCAWPAFAGDTAGGSDPGAAVCVRKPPEEGRDDLGLQNFSCGASVGIPLLHKGRLLGVVNVCAASAARLTAEEQALLGELGAILAYGLAALRASAEAAQTHGHLQRSLGKLEALESIVSRSPAFTLLWRREGDKHPVEFVSENVSHFGYTAEDFTSGRLSWVDVTHPDDVPRLRAELRRHERAGVNDFAREYRLVARSGEIRWIEERTRALRDGQGRITHYEGILLDVTDRRQLERQIQRSARLEAIGELAGGVAHDFNNLLTGILGFSQLAANGMPADSTVCQDLQEVVALARRGGDLTRQLLTFSRRQTIEPRGVDLNDLVANLSKMLKRLIGENIEFRFNPGSNLDWVWADPGQIEQVIVNLVVNARDAMPGGGRLTVETANACLERHTAIRPELAPGPYVRLSVADTGTGMDDATLDRIFDPFFTTKKEGEGTGLGLTIVYGVVKRHGGDIVVRSLPGRGSEFHVFLPKAEVPQVPAHPAGGKREGANAGGHETILLVEDEPSVRELARRMLEQKGYRIFRAGTPSEAELLFTLHRDEIALLLTDVILPQRNGVQLYEALLRERPSLKVLYVSGYAGQGVIPRDVSGPGRAFLPKPFTPDSLLGKVRQVLDGVP